MMQALRFTLLESGFDAFVSGRRHSHWASQAFLPRCSSKWVSSKRRRTKRSSKRFARARVWAR